ncbi:hypothetical protein FB451DRAFT_1430764 [Mycena latifolia]|nr:hypothetical protein FB451DRAFT_1430764 [Mycena latifolia]
MYSVYLTGLPLKSGVQDLAKFLQDQFECHHSHGSRNIPSGHSRGLLPARQRSRYSAPRAHVSLASSIARLSPPPNAPILGDLPPFFVSPAAHRRLQNSRKHPRRRQMSQRGRPRAVHWREPPRARAVAVPRRGRKTAAHCGAECVGRREDGRRRGGERARREIEVTGSMCNVYGVMHGGCVATVLDSQAVWMQPVTTVAMVVLLGLAKGFDGTGVSQAMNVHWHHAAPLQLINALPHCSGATLISTTRSVFADGRARLAGCEMRDKARGKLVVSDSHAFFDAGRATKL